MKHYNFSEKTGEFLSEEESIKDPIDEGSCLVPANATTLKPIKSKAGFATCFIDNKWVNVIDNRDVEKYLNHKRVVFKLGDEITDEMTDEPFTKEELKEQRIDNVQSSLMQLADSKQESAYKLMLGYKSTTKQIERYKDKYKRAKEGEFDEVVNVVIIQKFEAMRDAIRQFTDLIEYFRRAVDDLIQAGDLDKAEKAIEAGKSFNVKTTQDDIKALIAKLS